MSLWKMVLVLLFVVLIPLALTKYFAPTTILVPDETNLIPQAKSLPSPTKVQYSEDLTMVLVGDSMTEKLGNSDEIRANLKKYYPDKSVEVLNYSFGSTNILTVPDRLTQETNIGRVYRPILDIDFDMILIESFGHNPLSQYPLSEGLKKQTKALGTVVNLIEKSNPNAQIIFMATIAPNKQTYGLGQVDLSPEKRLEWANERTAYIKNHIDYANNHKIPVINIFEASLDQTGNGKLDYIDPKDNIHPSPGGVVFISQQIANFIYKNNLF